VRCTFGRLTTKKQDTLRTLLFKLSLNHLIPDRRAPTSEVGGVSPSNTRPLSREGGTRRA
jgi:hypothetical protein